MDYREICNKFGVGASTVCEKVNSAGTDGNQFRPVSVLGHGARVLPLESVPVPGLSARELPLELVPVPGHGVQICARASTKGYLVARAPSPGTKSERGLSHLI